MPLPGISLEAGNRRTPAATPHEGDGYFGKHSIYPEGSHQLKWFLETFYPHFACWVIFVTSSIIIYSTRVRKDNAIGSAVRHVEWTEEKDRWTVFVLHMVRSVMVDLKFLSIRRIRWLKESAQRAK